MAYSSLPKLIRIKASYLRCSLGPAKWIFDGREEGCFYTRCDLITGEDSSFKVLVPTLPNAPVSNIFILFCASVVYLGTL